MFPDLNEIKKRRIVLGMKQKQLANLAGVSQSLITKVECGLIDPAYSKVKKIFEALEQSAKGEQKKAGELMTRKILFARPSDSLNEFAKKMKEKSISQAPVFRDESNIGSVSDDTIVRAINTYREKYIQLRVADVMDMPFPTLDADAPLDNVRAVLKFSNAVLITEKGRITGIVSRSDVF
jgi:predicted transcriptional regulator